MLEKDIVAAILRYLKGLPHCFAWKQHGGQYGQAGLPDVIACIDGRFFAFEVKMSAGKITKLQEITLQRINDAKGNAFKVTSLQEVKEILERLIS
jgi:Holliday junction resolvase